MLTTGLFLFVLSAQPLQAPPRDATVKAIEESGRCVTVAENPDERVTHKKQLPPGKPPLLSFRLYDSKAHGGKNSGLTLDDAGH